MKFLLVGLGNPGVEYENTRHNVGFNVLEALAKKHEGSFSLHRGAHRASIRFRGKSVILIKPTTFMNLSGKSVNHWLQKEAVCPENLLIITDDLALPFGKLRLKASGSDGGHNGLKNIESTLQTSQYARLRFGIGGGFPKGQQSEYVLGAWSAEELEMLDARIARAVETCEAFCTLGVQLAMSQFNGT